MAARPSSTAKKSTKSWDGKNKQIQKPASAPTAKTSKTQLVELGFVMNQTRTKIKIS